MREIRLDATGWRGRDDFYDAILPALGAPSWHGRNLDALSDNIGSGGINDLPPPSFIRISNVEDVSAALAAYLGRFSDLIDDLRLAGQDIYLELS